MNVNNGLTMSDKLYNIAKRILVICLVILIGFFAINQYLDFKYKATFLGGPCKLCAEVNLGVESCINDLNKPKALYWNKGIWGELMNNTPTPINISQ